MSPDEAPMTSIAVPRMQRAVCPDCEHFHRRAIRDKCECCDADCRANDRGRGEPVNASESRDYRDAVHSAADAAWRAIGELGDYVQAVRSCIPNGGLPIPEDHERITTKLAAVDVAVAKLLAFVAQRSPRQDAVCDCYPGGATYANYEGPQEHCLVHGREATP